MLVYPVTFVILSFSLLLFFLLEFIVSLMYTCLVSRILLSSCVALSLSSCLVLVSPCSLYFVYFLFGFLMCLFQIFPHCFHLFPPVSVSSHSAMHIMSSNVLLLIIFGFQFLFSFTLSQFLYFCISILFTLSAFCPGTRSSVLTFDS